MLPRSVPPLSAATQDQKPGANRVCGDTGHHQVDQKVRLRSVDGVGHSVTGNGAQEVDRSGRLVVHAGLTPSTGEHERAGAKDLSGEHGQVVGDAALVDLAAHIRNQQRGQSRDTSRVHDAQCTVGSTMDC